MKIFDNIDVIDNTNANVYVLYTGGKVIQIDSGMKGNARRIADYYSQKKVRPDIVMVTHYHIDHIGALKSVADLYHPAVYVPAAEIPVIKGNAKPAMPKSIMLKIFSSFFGVDGIKDVLPYEKFKMDGISIIETPGHTPGSTSIFLEKERVMFVGDAVNNNNGVLEINRKFSLDITMAEKSKQKIEQFSPVTVLLGHGKPKKI